MYLSAATWQEIEARIKSGKKSIIIPIGSHEQHGPTGLIGTDAMCPQIILDEAQKQADILIGPNFGVGQAQHHMAFAGSMTLRPSTMIATIVDWTNSLVHHGFTHIYLSLIHIQMCIRDSSQPPQPRQLYHVIQVLIQPLQCPYGDQKH